MTKVCRKCLEEKKLSDYHVLRSQPDGLSYYCKVCIRKIGNRNPNKKYYDPIPALTMTLTTIDDWCGMYQALTAIGYDVNGDIHEQFTKKYGLSYKPRPEKNTIRFKPEDCDC